MNMYIYVATQRKTNVSYLWPSCITYVSIAFLARLWCMMIEVIV